MTQLRLAELLADRVEWVTGRREPAGPQPRDAESTVLVLLRALRLTDVVHGARAFAAGLAPEQAAAWRRSWTRTRFLFGIPANLTAANPPQVVAPGGSAAWLGPYPEGRRPGLSRLLKPVTGRLPELPDTVVPGTGRPRVLHLAVAGLALADYLVHLHHTLAEAVLLGRLRPEEPLLIRHRPALPDDLTRGLTRGLSADLTRDRPGYARVLPDPDQPDRLRLHAWLPAA